MLLLKKPNAEFVFSLATLDMWVTVVHARYSEIATWIFFLDLLVEFHVLLLFLFVCRIGSHVQTVLLKISLQLEHV